ncbi:MAG: hypothetical protein RLZZ568_471, partial [Cyanobacteriota bacterium]
LANLLEELYSQPPIDEITDVEILNEIKIVRRVGLLKPWIYSFV